MSELDQLVLADCYGNSHYVRVMRNFIRTTLLAGVLSLCPVAPGSAGPYEDGTRAFERGDYAAALRLWRPLAEQGRARAQYNLALMYAKGWGVPQDYVVAAEWYRRVAEQGLAEAQFNLAQMYFGGRGVPQDDAAAAAWYRKAAEQGLATAQFNLAWMYDEGRGVPQDYAVAHKWLSLAASRFPASEVELRDKAVKAREAIARQMTPAQIAEAQRLAREWKPKK